MWLWESIEDIVRSLPLAQSACRRSEDGVGELGLEGPQKVLEQANGVTEEACYNYLSQQGGQKRVRLAEADVISKGSGLHRIFWGHHYKGCFGSILLISSPYHPPPQASGYYFLAPPASC